MAAAAASQVSAGAGQHIPVVLGMLSLPLSLLFESDSFCFGVLPVLAEVTKPLCAQPIQMAQAALLSSASPASNSARTSALCRNRRPPAPLLQLLAEVARFV